MSFLPLPDVSLQGSTPGSVSGESVELLPHYILPDNHTYSIEMRVVAAGWISSIKTIRAFVQRFSVSRESGVTVISASGSQDAFGTASGSSWTVTATVGTSPDRFQITFTTGSSIAKTAVTADLRFTKAQ